MINSNGKREDHVKHTVMLAFIDKAYTECALRQFFCMDKVKSLFEEKSWCDLFDNKL